MKSKPTYDELVMLYPFISLCHEQADRRYKETLMLLAYVAEASWWSSHHCMATGWASIYDLDETNRPGLIHEYHIRALELVTTQFRKLKNKYSISDQLKLQIQYPFIELCHSIHLGLPKSLKESLLNAECDNLPYNIDCCMECIDVSGESFVVDNYSTVYGNEFVQRLYREALSNVNERIAEAIKQRLTGE